MGVRLSVTRRVGVVLAMGLWIAGCSGDTPAPDIAAPDSSLITVFYPVDGVVRGRGLPGAFPASVAFVSVRAHPTDTRTLRPVDEDGGFTFNIIGISGDLLEISGSLDELGRELGGPLYLRVPPSPPGEANLTCCQPQGTCQFRIDPDVEEACPDPATGATRCAVDDDCNIDEGEYLTIRSDRIQVTAPNEAGRISVTGVVDPNALIVVENRGLNGIGVAGPQYRSAQVTDDIGAFVVPDIRGRGDDEIVIQVRDLNGYHSAPVSLFVPDAELAGLDVIGAFAWEPLTNGARGPIAVHVAPWGTDGRGMCPDSGTDPVLCFSGGVDYDMVNFTRAEIAVGPDMVPLNPTESSTSALRPHNRGREGDVRSAAQDIVVVVDVSATATDKDSTGLRFDALAAFISGLRRRDRVGIVTYAGSPTRRLVADPFRDSGLRDFDNRQDVIDVVRDLNNLQPETGSDIFAAIRAAATNLRNARTQAGRIVVIAAEPPPGTWEQALLDYDLALQAVNEDLSRGQPELIVDVVGIGVDESVQNLRLVKDLTVFSQGSYYPTNTFGVEQTLTNVRSYLSGSFILLYDVDIPVQIGKSGQVSLEVEVLIGAKRATASYNGPLRILNSSNN